MVLDPDPVFLPGSGFKVSLDPDPITVDVGDNLKIEQALCT